MATTSILDMQIVPEKFSEYITNHTTELNRFVNSGIATPDSIVTPLINGMPRGGRFLEIPMWNALEGEEDVFSENPISVGHTDTSNMHVTVLIRSKSWGATDLSRVLGGADPMRAVADLLSDWRNQREQKIYLSILKALFDSTNGALKVHLNDISTKTGAEAYISNGATLETKQALGDHSDNLGMVFMHSMTHTYLQKNDMLTRQIILDPAGQPMEANTYLGYNIFIDDGMPITYTDATYKKTTDIEIDFSKTYYILDSNGNYTPVVDPVLANIGSYYELITAGEPIYDTYFIGQGAFIRQDGMPQWLIGTETDRDKLASTDYLINRWAQVIHPRGFSWNTGAVYPQGIYYPTNDMLATPNYWKLAVNHKKVPIACLRHKLG